MSNYEKSGRTFIAYQGREFSSHNIVARLNRDCPSCYTVKSSVKRDDNVVFAKIVYDNYVDDRDPNNAQNVMTVNGYDQDEISRAIRDYSTYSIDDSDKYHTLISRLYRDNGDKVFRNLADRMDFCSVIWDGRSKELIAGVTEGAHEYSQLFYGYTRENEEIMFSNDENVLKTFCNEIHKMDSNTYMRNGELFTIEGDKINVGNDPLIKKSRLYADFLLEGLNALLVSITKESVRQKIEENLEEYLASDDPKKRLSDYIVKELDDVTKREVLALVNKVIDEYRFEENVEETLRRVFDHVLEEYSKTVNVLVSYNVYLNENQVGQTSGGFYHEKYPQILRQISLDEPIMLIGPAGSGKNVAVAQVADSLGLKMYYTNNASNEFKLTGFIDAGGNYRSTEFYKAFKDGGVFFLDEIDNSDPSALIVINSALANGYMAFPHETIDRHPDFRIIAAANTWGKGADLQYVGRNALDAATLDRFDNIFFDYDRHLEECLYPNEEVLKFMWSFRDAVLKSKIPHVVSTRGIGKVYKKEMNGIPVEDILTSNVIKNLGQDDVNTIVGNMRDINSSNKYLEGVKRLTLRR